MGLTQIVAIPGWIQEIAAFLSTGLGGASTSTAAATLIIVYFSISGFLIGYLWTRLYLAGALTYEETAMGKMLATLEETRDKVAGLEREIQKDHAAKMMVHDTLYPESSDAVVDPSALMTALRDATPMAREEIFRLAKERRKKNLADSEAGHGAHHPSFHGAY